MKIEFIPSPNWHCRTVPITAVVIHYTASLNIDGTVTWFRDPHSVVSAHYVIGRDGRCIQMVPDQCVAWHAGRSRLGYEAGVNAFSIGIELVGTDTSGFTAPQLTTLDELVAYLCSRYHIPADRVVGHADISPGRKIDPDGISHQFDWARIRQVAAVAYASTGTPDSPVRVVDATPSTTHGPDSSPSDPKGVSG